MNTEIAVSSGNGATAVLDIPLERIRESKTNPRRTFEETKLAELEANTRLHGVLQPVLVRPSPDGEGSASVQQVN
jgi:ParB family transcriptional regulator, chromosome partitioning protein